MWDHKGAPTRDQITAPAVKAQSLNHWITREVLLAVELIRSSNLLFLWTSFLRHGLTVEANVSWGFLLLGLKTLSLTSSKESGLKQWGPSVARGRTEKEIRGLLMDSSGFD